MDITEVETWLIDSDQPTSKHGVNGWLFVTVHTDEGIIGIGESGIWGYLESSREIVKTFSEYLVGENPLKIDHHWQYMYRNCHFRGAAIMGAISAIDIALWDIAGKYREAPVNELLGGGCRDRARVYAHVRGSSGDELAEKCARAKELGFTAVGHLSPLLDEPRESPYFETFAEKVENATLRTERFRDAVGEDIDLCLEIHRRLEPEEAIVLADALKQYNPMMLEDPVKPDNFDSMRQVAESTTIPIATGERLHTIQEFQMLIKRDAVQYIRPDVCLAGGITHCKKIAAIAESEGVGVIPHNPLSPVCTAASLQLAAAIPNFAILEYPYMIGEEKAPGEDLFGTPFSFDDGFLDVPTDPGIGVTIDRDTLAECSYTPREFLTRRHEDGSVVDQ